jgi:hypothetical protein
VETQFRLVGSARSASASSAEDAVRPQVVHPANPALFSVNKPSAQPKSSMFGRRLSGNLDSRGNDPRTRRSGKLAKHYSSPMTGNMRLTNLHGPVTDHPSIRTRPGDEM